MHLLSILILIDILFLQFHMPTVWASRAFIDGLTQTLGQAQLLCLNVRDGVERMYTANLPQIGFQSFPSV